MKKQNKGITLIALVITIIVLLILAGVSIATLTGENGILTQAEEAKKETTIGEEKEAIRLAYNGAMIESKGKGVTAEKLNSQFSENGTKATASGTDTIKIAFETGRSYTVDSKGNIANYVNIADYVKVGQYVDYEPTKTDVNKIQSVEANKLTYTSPVGTIPTDSTGIITHGNGFTMTKVEGGGQKFTAKANDESEAGLKWRVLSVSDNKVELISEKPVLKDLTSHYSGKFVVKGGIGYLYAEQELNEICKIYGYGYGADTSIETTYTVSGPEDTPITGKITQSGARSITIEDLNKKAGIEEKDGTMKDRDGNVLDSSYGTEIEQTTAVYYATLSSINKNYPGQSTGTKSGYKYTDYSWTKSQITDTNIQDMLFNGDYWVANRCDSPNVGVVNFCVRIVYNGTVGAKAVCIGRSSYLFQDYDSYPVRPVVTLKSDVIDINTDYETEGEWKLK